MEEKERNVAEEAMDKLLKIFRKILDKLEIYGIIYFVTRRSNNFSP